MFHELLGSRDGAGRDALADAARERADAAADWPAGLGLRPARRTPPTPPAPTCCSASSRRPPPRDARRRSTWPRTRTRSRCCATAPAAGPPAGRHGRRSGDARAAQVARRLSGVAGRLPDRDPAAARPHGARGRRRSPHRPRGRRDRRCSARAPTCTSAGCLPDVEALVAEGGPLAIGTDSLASVPDLSLWGEISTLAAKFPDVPAARLARRRHPRRRARPRLVAASARSSRACARACSTCWLDDSAAPLESLVLNPTPTLRWVARA